MVPSQTPLPPLRGAPALPGIIDKLIKKSHPSGQVYVAQFKRGAVIHKMDHLACFAGGMYALAAQTIGGPKKDEWMKLAADITETCHLMYKNTKTGLSPEVACLTCSLGIRHATSVWQGNWFSVGTAPVPKATQ